MDMAKLYALHSVVQPMDDPAVRKISPIDLIVALVRGIDDFKAMPTHGLFLGLIYPVLGLLLASAILSADVLPLLFPLLSGFALLGPFAAVGVYELSRCRENGRTFTRARAMALLRSPAIGSIAALGLVLLMVFGLWLGTALVLYEAAFGTAPPRSVGTFVEQLLTTRQGWALIFVGNLAGLLFSAAVLAVSVVSFPLLLDRDISAAAALRTSVRAVARNPGTMALWGFIVAGALIAGFIPFFFGLAVVLPVLGHATWHLYRLVVAP
jgi:uncharacterized membrane protein